MFNETDLAIINWLRQMMHTHMPMTNITLEGWPLGEWMFYIAILAIGGEIWIMQTKSLAKKGAKK